MKFCTKKKNNQKMFIVLLIIIVLNFSIPNYSKAFSFGEIAGDLLKELVNMVASVGDVVMGALNHFMLGTEKIITSSMLSQDDPNLSNGDSWLKYNESKAGTTREVSSDDFDGFLWTDWKIPNFLYCPENIFANKIAMLDVDFIRPHKFTGVEVGASSDSDSEKKAVSAASSDRYGIRDTIGSWYKAFRNIAVVGLLTVLVYLGIRIVISSTATDKAKYKENLQDWLVALCLVFIIHFIMSGIMMLTDKFTEMLDNTINKPIAVKVTGSDVKFNTNLVGYVRFMAQSPDFGNCTAYTIMYLALVLYTVMFTFTYFKRFLYMAFFTMIAPLVALTYPIDKVKDGKAQAFDMWFKEYTMNAIIQPIHLILYSVFIGSAIDLAVSNPLYAIVAMAFLTSAEKFVKQMFGLDKAKTPAGLAAMAGGALAMKGIGNVVGKLSGKGGSSNKLATSGAGDDASKLLSRGKTPGVSMDSMATLAAGTGAGAAVGGAAGSAAGAASGAFAGGPARKEYDQQANNGNEASGNQQNNQNSQQNGGVNNPLGGGKQLSQQDLDKLDMDRSAWEREANNPDLSEEDRENARAHIAEIDEMKNKNTKKAERDIWREMASNPDVTADNRSDVKAEMNKLNDDAGENQEDQSSNTNANENTNSDVSSQNQYENGDLKEVVSEGTPRRNWRRRIKDGVSYAASKKVRNLQRAIQPSNIGKNVYKVAKKTASTGAHALIRGGAAAAVTAAAGTAVGAAAVVSGDKAGSMLATGGTIIAAGAKGAGGRAVSGFDNVVGGVANAGKETVQDFREGAYTTDELKQKKQAKFDKEWKRKEENYKYLMKNAKNIQTAKQAKEFINDDSTQKYLDNGVTDIGIIYNARTMAQDKGWSDEQAIARAQIAQGRGKNLKNNDSAQNALEKRLMSENSAITSDMAKNWVKEITKIADV